MHVDALESIQYALFLRAPPPDALQLWSAAIGTTPTGFQTSAPGHTDARGQVGANQVMLISQTATPRIDVLIQPAVQAAATPIADPDAAFATALHVISKLLPNVSVGRTAAVLQGSSEAKDAQDAANKVRAMLPRVQLPSSLAEVTFQLNSPKQSAIIGHRRLIQLCRWQTVQFQFLQLGPMVTPQAPAPRFAAHAYIDIYGEGVEALDTRGAREAVNEVSDVARSILKNGYDELL